MSKQTRFKSELLSGHKESALEVPFDPSTEWKVPAQPLWRGRRGHSVIVRINGVSFESAIVPRQKKFYLLVDRESQEAAGISEGDLVTVTLRSKPV
jgi:hypothetical protein